MPKDLKSSLDFPQIPVGGDEQDLSNDCGNPCLESLILALSKQAHDISREIKEAECPWMIRWDSHLIPPWSLAWLGQKTSPGEW